MSRPHAGTATNAGVWSKLTFRLNGRGDTCAYTRQPSAWSAWACSMMRSRARRVAAVLGQLVPGARDARRAAPPGHPVDVDELAVDLLDPRAGTRAPGRDRARAPSTSMSARSSSSSAARLGTAWPWRSWSTNDVDSPSAPAASESASTAASCGALVGGGGAVPRLVAHHVDAQVGVADAARRCSPRCRAPATRRATRRTTPTSTGCRW